MGTVQGLPVQRSNSRFARDNPRIVQIRDLRVTYIPNKQDYSQGKMHPNASGISYMQNVLHKRTQHTWQYTNAIVNIIEQYKFGSRLLSIVQNYFLLCTVERQPGARAD